MRHPNSGRGVHPTLRPSSLRSWFFDGDDVDLIQDMSSFSSGLSLKKLSSNSTPPTVAGVVGVLGRRGSKLASTMIATDDASIDSAGMLLETTAHIWVRDRVLATSNENILRFGGPTDSSLEVDNVLFGVRFSVNGKVEVFWERGAGISVNYEFSLLPIEWEMTLLTIRRRDVGGGNMEIDLFVNSQLVETSGPLQQPTGGSSALVRWAVLGAFTAALFATSCAEADVSSIAVYDTTLTLTEIEEDHRRGTLMEFHPRVDLRLEIEDGNGDFVDVTDLDGVDWVKNVNFSDAVGQASLTMSIELLREQRLLSTSVLRTDSKLNLTDVDDVTSYDPLLQLKRKVRLYGAWVPLDYRAEGQDWMLIFDGRIDKVGNGSEKTMIRCRDRAGELIDTHIEEEVLNPALGNAEEPEKQYSYGLSTGEPQETTIQNLMNDNDNDPANDSVLGLQVRTGSYDPLTLRVTAPSTTVLTPYRQTRIPVFTAMRELALLNGSDLKFVWDEEMASFEPTLFTPARDRIDSDILIEARDIIAASRADIDIKNVRTIFRVTYPTSENSLPVPGALPAGFSDRFMWAGTDGEGNRLPSMYEVRNDTAIGIFGRRFMELGERSASQLDTLPEVQPLAVGGIKDLSTPDFEFFVDLPLMPHLRVGDVIRFRNETLFTVTQRLACTSVDHSFGEKAVTKIGLRGKPTLGFKRWLELEQVPGQDRPSIIDPRLALFDVDRGPMLRVLRQIFDNSKFMRGGKWLSIPNGSFTQFDAGKQNPPTSWSPTASSGSAWVTDMEASTLSVEGNLSLCLKNNTAELQSGLFLLNGGTRVPYSFELVWQRGTVSAQVPFVDIEYYAADGITLIDTVTLEPGGAGAGQFPAVSTAAGTWFRSRVDGVVPLVGGAVFAKVVLGQSAVITGAATAIYIDSVDGYRSAYSAKMRLVQTSTVLGAVVNLNMNGLITPPDEWDPSSQMVDDSGSGPPNNGWYFDVLEPGKYDVSGSVTAGSLLSPVGTLRMKMVLVKNATFDAANTLVTGSVIAEGDPTDIVLFAFTGDGYFSINTTVDLNAGDRISLAVVDLSGGGLNEAVATSSSYFQVTQRLTQ